MGKEARDVVCDSQEKEARDRAVMGVLVTCAGQAYCTVLYCGFVLSAPDQLDSLGGFGGCRGDRAPHALALGIDRVCFDGEWRASRHHWLPGLAARQMIRQRNSVKEVSHLFAFCTVSMCRFRNRKGSTLPTLR